MEACTSRAAPLISRFKSNCSVMLVEPRLLEEVISVTPAMRPNWRSSGVATEEAMISGLAPGKVAATDMVGKSTCGRAETGNCLKATAPASASATVRSAVATGRRINGVDSLISNPLGLPPRQVDLHGPHANERLSLQAGRNKYKSRAWCKE